MPRLLRLARCQGEASFAAGCGGILCPILQRSPAGDSTLMTSAPKSDKITAALGPAMKLAKSTTFRPEKILSFGMVFPFSVWKLTWSVSPAVELRDAFFEESRRAFLFVFRCRAEAEIGSFQQQAFALARLHSLVGGLERKLHRDRRIGGDLFQDRLGSRDELICRNDLVDEPDAVSFLRADHLPRQNELQRAALADQPRQPLRSTAPRDESERDFGLTELGRVDRKSDGAGHCSLAAAAERKS